MEEVNNLQVVQDGGVIKSKPKEIGVPLKDPKVEKLGKYQLNSMYLQKICRLEQLQLARRMATVVGNVIIPMVPMLHASHLNPHMLPYLNPVKKLKLVNQNGCVTKRKMIVPLEDPKVEM